MTHKGLGTEMNRQFTDGVFSAYREIETIVVTPQHANHASCRALENAGYSLAWVGHLHSDDPADAGDAAIYVNHRARVT